MSCSWEWNGEKFVLSNNRCGFYPVYYLLDADRFAISPSISKLLEAAKTIKLDEDALSVYLRLGWLNGEDTLFESIKAVPPGSELTWHKGKVNLVSKGMIKSSSINIPRKEAIETYADLFKRSIENTFEFTGNTVLPLSGGRDSRHILLALHDAKRAPEACIRLIPRPPNGNEDARDRRFTV